MTAEMSTTLAYGVIAAVALLVIAFAGIVFWKIRRKRADRPNE